MKAICLCFLQMLKLIRRDKLLLAALPAPFLTGAALQLLVLRMEKALVRFTGLPSVLSPYYGLFDILLASITPVMLCFIAAMVMLEERDDRIDRYVCITGLGRTGYLASRIVLLALLAFAFTAALLPLFSLTSLSAVNVLLLSLAGVPQGVIIALLIIALSSNKLEGMVITKLSSLMLLGAAAPYFVPVPLCFCLSPLPSFWMGKALLDGRPTDMLLSFPAAGLWILALQKKWSRQR